jgi:hypothetical protein
MPTVYSTISLASSTRIRTGNHSHKPAPRTAEQLKEKRDARAEKQSRIEAYVQKWMEDTNQLAQTMAMEFDMEPRYFLDIFFQGGAHMVNHQDVINPYNAFRGLKSIELREREFSFLISQSSFQNYLLEGIVMSAPDIHTNFFDEYEKLTKDEKNDLCVRWEKVRSTNFQLHRDTPRAKVQDVANVVRNMKMLVRILLASVFYFIHHRPRLSCPPSRNASVSRHYSVLSRTTWNSKWSLSGTLPAKSLSSTWR